MIDVFSTLKGLLHCKRLHIDHCIFRLHYRFTVLLLLVFCIIVSTKQYAGEPIKCSTDTHDYSAVVDIYCFITSTYTVKAALNKTPADGAPHPGVYISQKTQDHHYHVYYQWVGFLLFIQAILFYFPHWLWKNFEGGRLAWLLEKDTRYCSWEEKVKCRDLIVDYIRSRWRKGMFYYIKYIFCEFLCLINVIGQMFLLDRFFDGEFLHFGTEVARFYRYGPTKVLNPFDRLFPRVTSCTYHYFGEAGRVRRTSVLCVLAVNVINEKIYLFLWFWFVILTLLTMLSLVYKLVVFSFKTLRLSMLSVNYGYIRKEDFRLIVENGDVGDYLFIYLLGQNMYEVAYKEVITELVNKLQGKIN